MNGKQIRGRLAVASAAAFAGDTAALGDAERWLAAVSAGELVRIDQLARGWRWEGPTLGRHDEWTPDVLGRPEVVVQVLASLHANGFLREQAVRRLATSPELLAARALAVRTADHVAPVREAATRALLARTDLEPAGRIVEVLERLADRRRLGDVRARYLRALADRHGETRVWAALRAAEDRPLRRAAFRHSFEAGLLGLADAIRGLAAQDDQVIRSLLTHVILERATPEVVASVLLAAPNAEARVLALVRLGAAHLGADRVEPLLADSSSMVRFWARRRWAELGLDAVAACDALAHGPGSPAVRARAFTGLVEAGGEIPREQALGLVASGAAPLVRVGLRQLVSSAETDDVPLLFGVLRDGGGRQAHLAADALVRLRRAWTLDDLGPLKASSLARTRGRAWLLQGKLDGWERIIAALEAARDPDPLLSAGARDLCVPRYLAAPTPSQRERLSRLLPDAPLRRDQRLELAFAVGLRHLV